MTDLISRKALLKAYGEWLHSDDEVPINDLITNAPAIEQGEAVYQSFIKGEGWFDVEKDDLKYVDTSYKRVLYSTPQQPQSVADALEEAANIKVNYTKSGRDDALTKIVEDVIQEAVESAISKYKEAIRALIKRNAEGVQ